MEVLLAGNTGYLTESFIMETFPQAHVLICGDMTFEKRKNTHILKLQEERADEAELEQYDLDRIVYFSGFLSREGEVQPEVESLCSLLEYARKRQVQFLYITGMKEQQNGNKKRDALMKAAEDICYHYQDAVEGVTVKILRSPYLYSSEYQKDWLYQIFQRMETGKTLRIQRDGEDFACFLYLDDLGELIFRIFDMWDADTQVLEIPDVFHTSWGEFEKALEKLSPGQRKMDRSDEREVDPATQKKWKLEKNPIREKYGWFPKISILEDLEDQYRLFQKTRRRAQSRWQWLRKKISDHPRIWKWMEIFLFFVFSEELHRILGNSSQFRYIDARLLFVVIVGTVYGLNEGVVAAFLAVCGLTLSYIREGANGLTLFYEPSNWLPYILYFIMGAVCGYIQMKNRKDIAFVKEENGLLKDKFLFIRALYQDTTEEKTELKRQLLGRKDSFGKIFDITRKLDSERPQEIFMQTVRVLEEVLENHSIQIYSFGKNPYFARLEAASKEIAKSTPHSLRLEDYQDAISVIEKNQMWVNRELRKDYPMYMTGVHREGRLVLVVCVKNASYDQMSLYYQNLVRILSGLVETALLRALNYQEILYAKQHEGSTIFMKEPYFMKKLELYHSMAEEQMTEYTLLKLDPKQMTLEEASDILASRIRESDTAGLNVDHDMYLILHQTPKENAGIVIQRLEACGFGCQIISGTEEGVR